jgi:hypothetical protein
VVAALQHPQAALGRVLKVQSFVTTPNAVLAEFERLTGGEKWTVEKTPLAKLKEMEETAWKGGSSMGIATGLTLRRIWAEGGTLYDRTDVQGIGLRPEDMETLTTAVQVALGKKKQPV